MHAIVTVAATGAGSGAAGTGASGAGRAGRTHHHRHVGVHDRKEAPGGQGGHGGGHRQHPRRGAVRRHPRQPRGGGRVPRPAAAGRGVGPRPARRRSASWPSCRPAAARPSARGSTWPPGVRLGARHQARHPVTDGKNESETHEVFASGAGTGTGQVPVRLPGGGRRLGGGRTPDRGRGPGRDLRHRGRPDGADRRLRRHARRLDVPSGGRGGPDGVDATGSRDRLLQADGPDHAGPDGLAGRRRRPDRSGTPPGPGGTSRATTTCASGSRRARSATRCWRPGSSVVVGDEVVAKALVRAVWTDDVAMSTRINRRVAEALGETELADLIQDGVDSHREGDVEPGHRPFRPGRAAGDRGRQRTRRVERLSALVEIDDAADRAGAAQGQGGGDRRDDRRDPVHPRRCGPAGDPDAAPTAVRPTEDRAACTECGFLLDGGGQRAGVGGAALAGAGPPGPRALRPGGRRRRGVPRRGPDAPVRPAPGTWSASAGAASPRAPPRRSTCPGRWRTSGCPTATPSSCASPTAAGPWPTRGRPTGPSSTTTRTRCPPNRRVPLKDGDRIHVGAWTSMTVERVDAGRPRRTPTSPPRTPAAVGRGRQACRSPCSGPWS